MSTAYVLRFEALSRADLPKVGGKGANLGELTRAGFQVPEGFCVTTVAFDAMLAGAPGMAARYAALDSLDGNDVAKAKVEAEATRAELMRAPMPPEVAKQVVDAWRSIGEGHAYAVRSSATAEDLPDASFAGQQDTYLDVRGEAALLDAVRRCWASLFTERAVLYRARQKYAHREVKLSVVVQRMVASEVSGILFTADPVSNRRGTTTVEASWGLGEALVGGLVNADLHRVDTATGALLELKLGDKALTIRSKPEGGTEELPTPEAKRAMRALDDAQLAALVELGRRIEAHYGAPQDVEWCLEDGRLYVVQSRPITSLFPVPTPAPTDGALHVYLSFGHVQMMTDPMPALGIQVWRLFLPFAKHQVGEGPSESQAVSQAASRIFLNFTWLLRRKPFGNAVKRILGGVYPELARGLDLLLSRPAFKRGAGGAKAGIGAALGFALPVIRRALARVLFWKPEALREKAEAYMAARMAAARAEMAAAKGEVGRLKAARAVLGTSLSDAFLTLVPNIAAGFLSMFAVRRLVPKGSTEDFEALERGLPGNVTTEMDLAVGDLGDLLRPLPQVVAALEAAKPREAIAKVRAMPEAAQFIRAWDVFLVQYGMRGPGEVDVARPRYRDEPGALLGAMLGGLSSARGPGGHRAHHAELAVKAEAAAARLVASAGVLRRALVSRLIRIARAGMGLREHPKFLLVQVLQLAREAALEAGGVLVARGALVRIDDAFLFRFDELIAALERDGSDLRTEAAARREVLVRDAKKSPPAVLASDGEVPVLPPRADLSPGAMAGTAASAGVVEGLAHVVLDPATEVLAAGEILVAPHTDPGWTPLFVHAAGLVTEVGGLITHGSVVAREYGIPAVVSVAGATKRIRSGQRIRVDGTRGVVEVLEEVAR